MTIRLGCYGAILFSAPLVPISRLEAYAAYRAKLSYAACLALSFLRIFTYIFLYQVFLTLSKSNIIIRCGFMPFAFETVIGRLEYPLLLISRAFRDWSPNKDQYALFAYNSAKFFCRTIYLCMHGSHLYPSNILS